METVIRTIGELDANDRSALERVVGHKLLEGQKIAIQIVSEASPPTPEPAAAVEALPEWCDVYAGLTDEQVDELDRSIVRSSSSRHLP
jgi:hypothetical protein